LDEKTAMALHEIKNKGIRHEQHVATTSKPEPIESFPGKPQLLSLSMRAYAYNPLDFPPVPSLTGLIGVCSKPFEKQLTSRDVRGDQSRLSMNK
jgi:hypothetical protein